MSRRYGIIVSLNIRTETQTLVVQDHYFSLTLHLFSQPTAIEQVSWFPEGSPEIPDSDELKDWMAVGQVLQHILPDDL